MDALEPDETETDMSKARAELEATLAAIDVRIAGIDDPSRIHDVATERGVQDERERLDKDRESPSPSSNSSARSAARAGQ